MDNLTEEERRLKVKPENAPDKAESIRLFAMSVKINGLQNKVQKDVAYNHLLAYAAMVERCEEVVKEILDKTKVSRFDEGVNSENYNVRAMMAYLIFGDEDHELRIAAWNRRAGKGEK